MRRIISACVLATVVAAGGAVFAAPTAHSSSSAQTTALARGKGKKVTVTCGDGTVYTGTHPRRGCKKHGGVKS
ncbi:MAG TPA: hypothetical protein VGQ10_09730 [Vicinamibacterales bacterium]|jgi:hypothetical protein|nr:hypothetical protein [Vicinamibacterales bacterium]